MRHLGIIQHKRDIHLLVCVSVLFNNQTSLRELTFESREASNNCLEEYGQGFTFVKNSEMAPSKSNLRPC